MNAFEEAEFGAKALTSSGATRMLEEVAETFGRTALGNRFCQTAGAIEQRIKKLFGTQIGREQLSHSFATVRHDNNAFLNAALGNRHKPLTDASAAAFARIKALEAPPFGVEDPAKAEALTQRARALFGITSDPLAGFPKIETIREK